MSLKILLAVLSLAFFVNQVVGAAIPTSGLQHEYEQASTPTSWWTQTKSDIKVHEHNLAKRAPYYFPETVPDAEELAHSLTSMREAGFVADSQTQESMRVPDAGIDPRARILPFRDLISELSRVEASTPLLLPPIAFFVFVACAACVATVYRNIKCER
ncbi:hypothetical protein N7523_008801 [Penicillium sp. IBT 18751x]|nr:hypothetical protein N7523_008801 [Penicillium sp. IBT 18751x]